MSETGEIGVELCRFRGQKEIPDTAAQLSIIPHGRDSDEALSARLVGQSAMSDSNLRSADPDANSGRAGTFPSRCSEER